jgi:hypothetical protein
MTYFEFWQKACTEADRRPISTLCSWDFIKAIEGILIDFPRQRGSLYSNFYYLEKARDCWKQIER